jgi:threonine/homoserine/homoserine lactone efflux protein
MLAYFIQGITFGFAAAVQPGPFQTYLISQTVSHGWKRALPAVLAPLLSDGPIIALVLLVLSRVPELAVQILRLIGGGFVIYLAVGAFKTWRNFAGQAAAAGEGPKSVIQAALVNLLSPNPYLFWSLVGGPILIAGWRLNPLNSVAMLVGFYFLLIGSMAAIVVLIGTTGKLGPKFNRALLGISALALLGLGLYQISLGVMGLVG